MLANRKMCPHTEAYKKDWCKWDIFMWEIQCLQTLQHACLFYMLAWVYCMLAWVRICTSVIYHQCRWTWLLLELLPLSLHIYFYQLIAYQPTRDRVIGRQDRWIRRWKKGEVAKSGKPSVCNRCLSEQEIWKEKRLLFSVKFAVFVVTLLFVDLLSSHDYFCCKAVCYWHQLCQLTAGIKDKCEATYEPTHTHTHIPSPLLLLHE